MEKIKKLVEWFNGLERRGKFAVCALVGLAVVFIIEFLTLGLSAYWVTAGAFKQGK